MTLPVAHSTGYLNAPVLDVLARRDKKGTHVVTPERFAPTPVQPILLHAPFRKTKLVFYKWMAQIRKSMPTHPETGVVEVELTPC